MGYGRELGRELMERYLAGDGLRSRREHSASVGERAYELAERIAGRHPELGLDAELVGFLGYAHDIGYSLGPERHELASIELLLREGVEPEVARRAMHGQLAEQYGEREGCPERYLPVGLEGVVLTYADMTVRTGLPVTVRERAAEIEERVRALPIPDEKKAEIVENLHKALPRFERYEGVVLALAGEGPAREQYEGSEH